MTQLVNGSVEVASLAHWEKPSFEEVAMNAEIGAYEGEPGGDPPYASSVHPEQRPSPR